MSLLYTYLTLVAFARIISSSESFLTLFLSLGFYEFSSYLYLLEVFFLAASGTFYSYSSPKSISNFIIFIGPVLDVMNSSIPILSGSTKSSISFSFSSLSYFFYGFLLTAGFFSIGVLSLSASYYGFALYLEGGLLMTPCMGSGFFRILFGLGSGVGSSPLVTLGFGGFLFLGGGLGLSSSLSIYGFLLVIFYGSSGT